MKLSKRFLIGLLALGSTAIFHNYTYAATEENAEKVINFMNQYYVDSRQISRNNPIGRVYTDHTNTHVQMTKEKAWEIMEVLKTAIKQGTINPINSEGKRFLSANLDPAVLIAAALSHDSGMSGNGYVLIPVLDKDGNKVVDSEKRVIFQEDAEGNYVVRKEDNSDYNEIRANHAFVTAQNILSHRKDFNDLGFTDDEVDFIAALAMGHSGSSSGVKNIARKSDWLMLFKRIDSVVLAYNAEHPNDKIFFNHKHLENDDVLPVLTSGTLALRLGDVSRDSGPQAVSNSGEPVFVDRASFNDNAYTIADELKDANITISHHKDKVKDYKSKQVHAGEQNIILNRSYLGKDGIFTHEITILDANSGRESTQSSIEDHIKELYSLPALKFNVSLNFYVPCNKNSKKDFENFRRDMKTAYPNVDIILPW